MAVVSQNGAKTHVAVEAEAAAPDIGKILLHARRHLRLTLRQVEERTGIPNAHVSQIERGVIKRPDLGLLWELAELYALDYVRMAEWAGHLDAGGASSLSRTLGIAVRAFAELPPDRREDALRYLASLRPRRT